MKIARYFADIVDYGEAALEPVSTASLDHFLSNRNLRDMVYYRVQCVSEAVKNVLLLDASIVERYPHIEWRKVRDIGNVFRHEYGNIEAAAIWNTITGDQLPSLIAVAKSELTRLE